MSKKNVIYVTADGLKQLETELKELKTIKRVEIAEKLKEAISFGDLSENSEYEDARSEQAQVEKRILDLDDQLKNIEVVKETGKKENLIRIGATITLVDADKNEETYKLVGTTESNILSDTPKISNESAIGKAVIGKKKGDTVKVKTLAGIFEYKIVKLS